MKDEYARLLAFRNILFPDFDEDQKKAAKEIFIVIESHIRDGDIRRIIDVGCGTGEILDNLRKLVIKETSLKAGDIEFVGLDCCREEIDLATRRMGCRFICAEGEKLRELDLGEGDWTDTLVICVGHTITHFEDIEEFFGSIKALRPALILVDFYHKWDRIVEQLTENPTREDLAPQKIGPEGEVYILTTRGTSQKEGRIERGIQVLSNNELKDKNFWTTQIRQTSTWFIRGFEALNYIPERTLEYDAGYGPMKAFLFSQPSRIAVTLNQVYYEVVSDFATKCCDKKVIQDAMEMFGTRVVAIVLPFDRSHIFGRYLSIVKGVHAPKAALYIAEPDNTQMRYPTAFGLYLCLLHTISSGAVIPLSELGISTCSVDKRFGEIEAGFFKRSTPEISLAGGRNLQGSAQSERSFFVVPFYYADLPLFCLVVNFAAGLPTASTDQSVYTSILQNVFRLMRRELQSCFESAEGEDLLSVFVDRSITKLTSLYKLSVDDAIRAITELRTEAQSGNSWKSWLMTIPSHPISKLTAVREERKTLDKLWDRATRRARSDILVRVADWFRAGMFFEEEQTAKKGKDNAHEQYVKVHDTRVKTMLKLAGVDCASGIIESVYFGENHEHRLELHWLANKLEILLSSGPEQDKNETFRQLKSVLCRTEENTGDSFRFEPMRLLLLCAIYHGEKVASLSSAHNFAPMPMANDHTMRVVEIARSMKPEFVDSISMDCEYPPSEGKRTVYRYTLNVILKNAFNAALTHGGDYRLLKTALMAVGLEKDTPIPAFKELRVVFRLIASEDENGKTKSLVWNDESRIAEVVFSPNSGT